MTGARELAVFIYVHACVCTCIQYFLKIKNLKIEKHVYRYKIIKK